MPKKKSGPIKAFSPELNDIIHLKRLTERQYKIVFNKLVSLVKTVKSGEFSFVVYVKTVIENVLTKEETKNFVVRMRELQETKKTSKSPMDAMAEYRTLGNYYSIIAEYYPELRVEYVCYEINQLLPDSVVLDSLIQEADLDFSKKLDKKIKGVKTEKDKYSFSSLKEIEVLNTFLNTEIIGQGQAVDAVCNSIKLKAAEFATHVNLFFIGKTGRGKTQLARKLGEKYSPNFWVINCGEFTNGHEVGRLLGSPPGYIGHAEKSVMMDKADKSNRWTIVFDEIEKAHPKFYNFLLALMDTGKCTDNSGNEIDFTDSIFILTSNCGLQDLKSELLSFNSRPTEADDREELLKSLSKHFSPEFRGRVDEFVFFNDLTKDDIKQIAKNTLAKYPIKDTPEIVSYVIDKGFSEEYGARDIERTIKTLVALPLADEILSSRHPMDGTSKYDAEVRENKIEIINTISV